MIYLALRIFVFLLLALALGVAAGWLWRNREAGGDDAALDDALLKMRDRQAELETGLRAGEARLEVVMAELEAREEELAVRHDLLRAERQRVAELEQRCAAMERERGDIEQRCSALESDRADLEQRLAAALAVPAPAAPDAADLATLREQLERSELALSAARRRVEELARERELQRGALAALEQQLELAREARSRAASG